MDVEQRALDSVEDVQSPPKRANGWTEERRRKQSEAIRRWTPWNKSTGPKSDEGKAKASMSAFKGNKRERMREVQKLTKQLARAIKERL